MVKRLFGLFALALVAGAQAQYAYPEEDRINAAFQKLRGETRLFFLIEGSDTVGNTTTLFKTAVYWQTDTVGTKPRTRLAIETFKNDALVHKITSNGENVWDYDFRTFQYQTLNHGGYGAARPETYEKALLAFTSRLARGPEAYAVRLLREVVEVGEYRSWMPGLRPYYLADSPPTKDPVLPDYTYSGSPTTDLLMYNAAPKRAMVFQLEDDPGSDIYRLDTIYYSERVTVGTRERKTHWTLRPFKGYVFDEEHFRPYTYQETRGWKPVAGQIQPRG